jgi:hypothetical protein
VSSEVVSIADGQGPQTSRREKELAQPQKTGTEPENGRHQKEAAAKEPTRRKEARRAHQKGEAPGTTIRVL